MYVCIYAYDACTSVYMYIRMYACIQYKTTVQNAKVTCCSSLITSTRPRGSHSEKAEEEGDEDEDDTEERGAANSLIWYRGPSMCRILK